MEKACDRSPRPGAFGRATALRAVILAEYRVTETASPLGGDLLHGVRLLLTTLIAALPFVPAWAHAGAWTRNLVPNSAYARALAVKPGTGGTTAVVFAGFDGGGIYRSDDAGATWNRAGVADSTHLTTSRIQHFAFDPNDANTMIAVGRCTAVVPCGVYKSTDGGSTWTVSSTNIPSGAYVRWATYATGSSSNVFVAIDGGNGGGVYRSTDGGSNWSKVCCSNANVRFVIADPNDTTGNTLYASHSVGVPVTTDGGANWSSVNSSGGTPLPASINGQQPKISIDAANSLLYATVISASGSGIYRTTTSSAFAHKAAWAAFNGTTPPSSTNNLSRVTFSPDFSYRLVAEEGVGLFGSSDAGDNWTLLNNGLPVVPARSWSWDPSDSNTLFFGTSGGIYKTADLTSGAPPSFTQIGMSIPVATGYGADGGTKVSGGPNCTGFLGTSNGVVKSADCGRTASATGAIAFGEIVSVAVDKTTLVTTAYAGSYSGGIYQTVNGGASWTQVNSGLPDVRGATVRAIQVDGETVWSSPIFVTRP